MFGRQPFTDTFHQDHHLEPRLEPRHIGSFDEAAEEAASSRLYAGIHYPFDNENGLAQGRCIGHVIVDRITFARSGAGGPGPAGAWTMILSWRPQPAAGPGHLRSRWEAFASAPGCAPLGV
jgi:hypothetical protein